MPPLVQADNLSKSYGTNFALDGVSIQLAAGEVHSLVGENGAGKSTLIKILGGQVAPSAGTVVFDGQPLPCGSVDGCEQAGVSVVHQELLVFPHLTVQDNLTVGRETTRWFGAALNHRAMAERCQNLLDRVGCSSKLNQMVKDVPVAQRQLVAIARALDLNAKLLVLDEPTASLTHREVERVHQLVNSLSADGIAVLFVSHRLEEVEELSDKVTVLRDGRVTGHFTRGGYQRADLLNAMVGRDLDLSVGAQEAAYGETVLNVRALTRTPAFDQVDLQVRRGEILGLGGLVGAGRTEVARAIFGADSYDSGAIEINGHPLTAGDCAGAVACGVAMVPEERQSQGLVLGETVWTNASMAIRPRLATAGFINRKGEDEKLNEPWGQLDVRPQDPLAEVGSLSGGNQQKVVFCKWLALRPQLLILDEPTRGVDVATKHQIHELIRGLAAQGSAILMISSDTPELLALSHRIVVMRGGRVVGEAEDENSLLRLAFGEDR